LIHCGRNPTHDEFWKLCNSIVEVKEQKLLEKLHLASSNESPDKPRKQGSRGLKFKDDKDDRFDFDDFIQLLHTDLHQGPNDKAELMEAMATFDLKENGYISREALKEALTMMQGAEPLDEEDAEEILRFADKEKNGMINYEEFVTRIMAPVSE